MDAALRQVVRERAGHCSEFCQRPKQASPLVPLQIEHGIPRKHGGGDEPENLALACVDGNFRMGTNIATLVDGQLVPLFHPRTQTWEEHFELQ